MVYRLLRPLLFRLEPEKAHALTVRLLRLVGAAPPLRAVVRAALAPGGAEPVRAFGLSFPNRLGLAAGFDKDALAWRGLACLGFGHVEVGTVTPRPQPGNPGRRVFRLVEDRSLVNRLGFPSRGGAFVAGRLRDREPHGPIVGVNLGKQRETPLEEAAEDYERLMSVFAPLADYLVVNVSSPNTPGLRELQRPGLLHDLLARLARRRGSLADEVGRPVPLLVKIAPDLDDAELDGTLEVVAGAGVDGLIATNTTIGREGLRSPLAREEGGLSGAALARRSTEVIRRVRARLGDGIPVVGCGGIMGPGDARAKLDAGATLLQIYTGLVFEGPGVVRRILDGIDATGSGSGVTT